MSHRFSRSAVAILAALFPAAAFADLSGTVTLSSGSAFSLDTGTTSSSGGDILWSGTAMTPQGNAKAINIGPLGSTFGAITQSALQQLGPAMSKSAIPASTLVSGDVFAVLTNGGNYAKVLVTGTSGTSISLQYTTYETAASTGPTITKVLNNYSYIPSGFTNSGISPSTIFTIFGSGLAAASTGAAAGLQDSTKGLPTTWNGATVSVTVGGKTVTPGLYYALPTQIAGVLPAATPTGSGTLTVSYNGATSSQFTIQVVPSALGLDTYYGTGTGLITATSLGYALFNYTNSASPGQTIVLWGSGLGADTADSDTVYTTTPHSVNQAATQIYFGGVPGTIGYAGSSGYPGLNQINVTIPASSPIGCWVSVAGVVNGVTSNFGTLPIEQGGGVCTDSIFGTNGTQLNTLSGQSTVSSGDVFVIQSTSPGTTAGTTQVTSEAAAIFDQFTGSYYGASSGSVSIPGCIVTETVTGSSTGTETGLDAGTITVTGPSGGPVTLTTVPQVPGDYFAQLAAGAIPASGGTFTFNGSGGANVGPFTATVTFPNPPLAWTNQSTAATVNRSQGLTVNWTGGAAGSYVAITGASSSSSGASGFYTCLAPVSALSFTVPSYVLQTLPAGTGTTGVENSTNFTNFTASGISSGFGFGAVSFSVNSTYN